MNEAIAMLVGCGDGVGSLWGAALGTGDLFGSPLGAALRLRPQSFPTGSRRWLCCRHETEKRGGAGKGNWGAPAEDPTGWEVETPVKGGWGDDDFGQTKADQNGESGAVAEATPAYVQLWKRGCPPLHLEAPCLLLFVVCTRVGVLVLAPKALEAFCAMWCTEP